MCGAEIAGFRELLPEKKAAPVLRLLEGGEEKGVAKSDQAEARISQALASCWRCAGVALGSPRGYPGSMAGGA